MHVYCIPLNSEHWTHSILSYIQFIRVFSLTRVIISIFLSLFIILCYFSRYRWLSFIFLEKLRERFMWHRVTSLVMTHPHRFKFAASHILISQIDSFYLMNKNSNLLIHCRIFYFLSSTIKRKFDHLMFENLTELKLFQSRRSNRRKI